MFRSFCLICCFCLLSLAAYAQSKTGAFTGQVADATGAAVPRATVTVVSQALILLDVRQADARPGKTTRRN